VIKIVKLLVNFTKSLFTDLEVVMKS